MASGTQSYTTTSGSLIDPARRVWEDRDKHKKKIEGFKRRLNTIYDMYSQEVLGAASQTPMLSAGSDFLLEPGAKSLPPAQDLIEGSSDGSASNAIVDVLGTISDDIAAQNQLVAFQTKALTDLLSTTKKLAADEKRLRKERRLEAGEDLSGTQGVIKKLAGGKSGGGGGGFDLFGAIDGITDTIQLVRMFRKGKWLSKLNKGMKGFNFKNPFKNWGKASKASNVKSTSNLLEASNLTSFKKSGEVTSLGKNAKIFDAIETTAEVIPPGSTVNNLVKTATNTNKIVNNTSDASRSLSNVNDLSKVIDVKNLNKVDKVVEPVSAITKVDNIIPPGASKAIKGLNKTPLKYAIPGVSGVSGIANIASGNYAEGALDLADAGTDVAIATGAMSTTSGAGAVMGPAIAVTGAGLVSGWLGELTRGTDEWVRGDGKNAVRNALGDITAFGSAALETIGTPFTGLFSGIDSLIKHGNFSESNKKMAKVDSNIREGFRKFFNAVDFMDVVSDDVGGWGTLSWYGKENVDEANEQLLKDKGITTENENVETNNETKEKLITSSANMIEKTTDIEKSIIKTVLDGGTSGDEELDQRIFNHYRILELKSKIASAEPGSSKELDAMMEELAGLESGEINAERPIFTSGDDVSSVTNGDETNITTANNTTGDINNISKSDNTVNKVLNQKVTETPQEKPIIVNVANNNTGGNSQGNETSGEHVTKLNDSNTDAFKNLNLQSVVAA